MTYHADRRSQLRGEEERRVKMQALLDEGYLPLPSGYESFILLCDVSLKEGPESIRWNRNVKWMPAWVEAVRLSMDVRHVFESTGRKYIPSQAVDRTPGVMEFCEEVNRLATGGTKELVVCVVEVLMSTKDISEATRDALTRWLEMYT